LYEALTGQLPFVADSYSGLVLAVAHEPPRPPRELCADVPPELERVILQALSKQRQDRPQTVDSLHELLAPFATARRRDIPAQGHHTPAQRREGAARHLDDTVLSPADAPRAARAQTPAANEGASKVEASKVEASKDGPSNGAAPGTSTRRSLSGLPVVLACGLAIALLARAGFIFLHEDGPASLPSPAAPASAGPSRAYLQAPAESQPQLEEIVPAVARPAVELAESAANSDAPTRSCEEARRAGKTADGLRSIDPDGSGPLRAFEVHCAGMAGAGAAGAREYLPLAADTERNSTRFRYGQSTCPCPDLVRRFTHVRLDPSTLVIDPIDGTFATYDRPLTCERQHRHQCGESTNLAWGGAGSCRGRGDTSGSASIDLSGTGFVLAPDTKFVPAGFGAAGSSVFSADRGAAQLSGGGLCGSLVPEHGGVRLVAAR